MWLFQQNQDPEFQRRYPKYVDRGTFRLDISSERVNDTTDLISHPELPEDDDDPFKLFSRKNYTFTLRIHKRIIMTPCGRPLREIKILFIGEGVNIRGVLIYFDNALPKDRDNIPIRPIMSSSPLFESIGSLQALKCQRNELDDCESLVYLIRSLGIYGINSDYCLNYEQKRNLSLTKWCTGDSMDIGNEKRKCLKSGSFDADLLEYFNQNQPGWEALKILAAKLYKLFCNYEVEEKGRGYKSGTRVLSITFDDSILSGFRTILQRRRE